MKPTLKTILIDADDTLWENNIYFEKVIEGFLDMMVDLHLEATIVCQVLNEIERTNIHLHGYGIDNFVRSLKETCLRLIDPSTFDSSYLEKIDQMVKDAFDHPVELFQGVEEVLEHLSRCHRTILFTKGNPEEQQRKIDASGLSHFFHAIEIVPEKNHKSFQALICRRQLSKESTWMVGNSPKSDINPAIAVGIKAIYIPHPRTWELEKEALSYPEKVIILDSFSSLSKHF